MNKQYTQIIEGCIWCPFHKKYAGDKRKEGRCSKVIVRNNNYKLIRENELKTNMTSDYDYRAFPEWCPLDNEVK